MPLVAVPPSPTFGGSGNGIHCAAAIFWLLCQKIPLIHAPCTVFPPRTNKPLALLRLFFGNIRQRRLRQCVPTARPQTCPAPLFRRHASASVRTGNNPPCVSFPLAIATGPIFRPEVNSIRHSSVPSNGRVEFVLRPFPRGFACVPCSFSIVIAGAQPGSQHDAAPMAAQLSLLHVWAAGQR